MNTFYSIHHVCGYTYKATELMCCAVIRRLRDWVINNCLLHLCTWKLLARSIPKECNQADVLQQCWPLLIALCPLLCTLRSTLTITHSSHSQSLSGGWKGAKAFISSFSTASPEEVTEANPHLMKSGKKNIWVRSWQVTSPSSGSSCRHTISYCSIQNSNCLQSPVKIFF